MSSEVAVEMKGGRWKRYPAYRDSGVEWIEEVPEEWEVIVLRRLLDPVNGIKIGPFGSQLKSDIIQPTGFKVYGQENVIARNFDIGYRFVDEDKFKELAVCEIISGDIVVTMMGTTGRCQVVPKDIQKGIMDSHLLRIKINEITVNPIFLEILIDEALYIKHQIKIGGKGSIMHGLNSSIIKSLYIVLPSLPEQRAIAAFLDRETGRIDTLIEKKERQIDLLQDKRASLISHAVTKGLDPDVKMKDSGVEWLGDVPEGWKLRKLKHVAKINLSNVDKKTKEDEDSVKLCNYVDVYKNDYINSDINFMEATASPNQIDKFALREGDVLITKDSESWEDIAVPAYIPTDLEDVICGYHLAHIRPDHVVVNGEYIFRSFSAICLNYQFKVEANGITRFGIGKYPIDNSLFLVPPINEQKSIAAFLDRETGCIDTLTIKLSESISKLREYRTALISAAVTGKIDVREDLVS